MIESESYEQLNSIFFVNENSMIGLPEEEYNTNLIKEAIESLNPETQQFAFFDLGFSDAELALLKKIPKQEYRDMIEFSGMSKLEDKIANFFSNKKEVELEILKAAQLVTNLIGNILEASGFDAAKITILNYGKHFLYDEYWHIDKNSFEILEVCPASYPIKHNYVFIIPLIGETTLFNSIDQKQKEIFNLHAQSEYVSLGYFNSSQTMSEKDYEYLFNKKNTKFAQRGQGSVHFAGIDYGTIHATPNSENGRLLAIITPDETWAIESLKTLQCKQN